MNKWIGTIKDSMIITAVVREDVCLIPAYYAICLSCKDWRCHKQSHESQDQALKCAERHGERKHSD